MTALRLALLASLRSPPDAIEFAGSLADIATELDRIARRVRNAQSAGISPGSGTLRRIEVIHRRLGQSTAAYRHGRGM